MNLPDVILDAFNEILLMLEKKVSMSGSFSWLRVGLSPATKTAASSANASVAKFMVTTPVNPQVPLVLVLILWV